jgi:murein DD-endopeptidase MepM/ murein hydrolase activator NlpD
MRGDTNQQLSNSMRPRGAGIRLVFAGLIGTLAASCSSDAMRFSDNPFTSPFGKSADATATVPALPAGKVQSRPLAAPKQASAEPDKSIVVGAVRKDQSPAQPVKSAGVGTWSTEGGTSITVARDDTVAKLSSRYGVPETALRTANNIRSGANPEPGSRIIIPVYRYGVAAGHPAPTKEIAAAKPAPETPKKAAARLAAAAPKEAPASARKLAAATPGPEPVKPKVATAAPAQPQPAKPKEAPKAAPSEEVDASLATGAVKPDAPQFRWPARGRVISRFGGDGNDGINIAVPEGTSVRAAEDGTVAYVGDEIKGYGKLVLVRHANGWVSAYANNGDLVVKKGEVVKRGQVLAKSGQTGNVTSPQLHFELRRGKTPVDPQQFLAGG